jgi:hypothetical protein
MSFDYMRVDDILAIHADQIARYSGDAGEGEGEGEGIKNPGL